ncbi:uncharacterized protein PAC_17536 [Phialocephala subalpina]|uniref:Uncharacterized protein n=1 Tax=Phialocephala subalpina TaxID=576137 RepID=A0A1L7XRT0_9HELO|nr:uncharacterized protein PAC_17536 [Phialocephala subalpina]
MASSPAPYLTPENAAKETIKSSTTSTPKPTSFLTTWFVLPSSPFPIHFPHQPPLTNFQNDKHPKLAKKMSCVQTGYFTSSYKLTPKAYFNKLPSGTYQMSFLTLPDKPIPHLAVNADVGSFVQAVSKMLPGKNYISLIPQPSSSIANKPTTYTQCTLPQFMAANPDPEFGREAGDMFKYSAGRDMMVAGIEVKMTSLKE